MVKEFIFRIFISIISYCLVRMPYLLTFIRVRILISKRRSPMKYHKGKHCCTLVSSYDGITSLFMCSSVSDAWKVFWDRCCMKCIVKSFIEWIAIYVYLVICTLDVFTKDRNSFQAWGNAILTIIFLIYYYHVYLFREGPFYTLIRTVT